MKGPTLSLLLAASHIAIGADLGTWRDLHVRVESLPGPILVNGLPLMVSRATGSDVHQLAKRLSDKWHKEGGAQGVRAETNGTWTILSRIHDAGMEVVQWRGSGGDAELLWSRSELTAHVRTPARGGLRFPTGCIQGRTVSGQADTRAYSEQVARCKGSPRATLLAVQAVARAQGYEVLARDGQLLARNSASEVTVFAWRPDDGSVANDTSLVYLRAGSAGTQTMNRGTQSGQASVEYLIVAGAMAVALFYPIAQQGCRDHDPGPCADGLFQGPVLCGLDSYE